MEKDFRFTPRKPRAERDRTPDEESFRRMSEGGKKGGRAGIGVPRVRRLTGSKYDSILDAFIDCPHELVKLEIDIGPGRPLYSLTRTLNDRIEDRKLEGIKASTVNDAVYLEKI